MIHNLITSASMLLHTSENIRYFFEHEQMKFKIFRPHQEQSPDLNAGCFLEVMSKYEFSMNHAMN